MRARSTWNSCFIPVQSLYLIFSFWCFLEQLRKRRLSTFHATANPRPSPVSLNFLRCTPSHQNTMKKVEFLQISWTLTWIYNMRFTFPWVFVENTPHLIWIKPEPHKHSLPPWPCNGWANVFTRHQKCISRRQKCIFFLIFPTLISSFTVVVVGKSETCRLSASISWDAFRKGRERLLSARTHINISFLSSPPTCWLTKTEEFRSYNSLNICKSYVYMMPGAHNSNSSQGMKGMNSCRESGSWENLQESEKRHDYHVSHVYQVSHVFHVFHVLQQVCHGCTVFRVCHLSVFAQLWALGLA